MLLYFICLYIMFHLKTTCNYFRNSPSQCPRFLSSPVWENTKANAIQGVIREDIRDVVQKEGTLMRSQDSNCSAIEPQNHLVVINGTPVLTASLA